MAKDPYRYFRIEARELLENLSQGVLALEKLGAERELISRLLRWAHTLKGAARVVKQPAVAELAHALENSLAPLQHATGAVPREHIDGILALLDAANARVTALEAPPTPVAENRVSLPNEEPFETVRVEVDEVDALLEGVSETGIYLAGLRARIDAIVRARDLAALVREHTSQPSAGAGRNGALRVRGLADELVQTLEGLRDAIGSGIEHTERELGQVRDRADQLRLLPSSTLFPTLERAARDAAQTLGRRIQLTTSGGDVRLDAHVLAAVRGALLHVVRNAVAHGIESASERATASKSPSGRIALEVERRGSRVAFICRDDGRGLDVDAIRHAAESRGLATPAVDAFRLDDAVRLVLDHGVTTSPSVTELSGRGVGLGVLRDTVARLKGEVALTNEPGGGTRVEIVVPVSLSSVATLLVETGGKVVSIPLDCIQASLRLQPEDVARAAEGDSITHEGIAIPFLPLARMLQFSEPQSPDRTVWSAVVIAGGGARIAVGVDRLLGTTQAVVRPLPPLAAAEPTVAGASFDSAGEPILILDPLELIEATPKHGRARRGQRPEPTLPILVIDDSLTTRMLEQSILESAGYAVVVATSGEEALDKARERPYGLFLVDVEMPGIDGFEFLERTRQDPALARVPAILVTSRNSAEDRQRGQELGARAYIVKSEFDQAELLRRIRELVG